MQNLDCKSRIFVKLAQWFLLTVYIHIKPFTERLQLMARKPYVLTYTTFIWLIKVCFLLFEILNDSFLLLDRDRNSEKIKNEKFNMIKLKVEVHNKKDL